MKIFAILQEPANYTLDLIKNAYEARGVGYGFINRASLASDASAIQRITKKDIFRIFYDNDAVVINGYTGMICLLAIWLNVFFFKKPMALESDTELRIPCGRLKRIVKWIWLHFLFTRRYCYGFAGGNYGHKDLFRYYGMSEERIFLMPMMIDNAKFKRHLPDFPNKPFRFGYLGRLIPLKQVEKIIAALPDGTELHIVGDGSERSVLELVAHNKAVVFYGAAFNDDKVELLHSFDCLVLYSSHEAWGLVVNEALASGIPVIVSDRVGARKDLVEGNDKAGLIAKWDDVNDLADKMQRISQDEALWRQLSQNAIERMANWSYTLYGKNFDAWAQKVQNEIAC